MATNPLYIGGNATPIESFLRGCVNMPITEETLRMLLVKRNVPAFTDVSRVDKKRRDLLEADLYMWVVRSPSITGGVEDADNNWRHKEGGVQLNNNDKKWYQQLAEKIYAMYGENDEYYVESKSKIKITSSGIYRNNE